MESFLHEVNRLNQDPRARDKTKFKELFQEIAPHTKNYLLKTLPAELSTHKATINRVLTPLTSYQTNGEFTQEEPHETAKIQLSRLPSDTRKAILTHLREQAVELKKAVDKKHPTAAFAGNQINQLVVALDSIDE